MVRYLSLVPILLIACGTPFDTDGPSQGSVSSSGQIVAEGGVTTVSGRVGGAFDIEVTWRGLDGSNISKQVFPNSEAFYTTMYNTFKAKYSALKLDPKSGITGGPDSATDATWQVKLNAQTGLADLHENMLVYVEPEDNVGIPRLLGTNRVLSDRTFSFQVDNDLDAKVYRIRASKSIDVTLTSTDKAVPPLKACYIFSARENATFGALKKGVNITKFEVMITGYQCEVSSNDPWGSFVLPTAVPSKAATVSPTVVPVVTVLPAVTALPATAPIATAVPTPSDLTVGEVSDSRNWKFSTGSGASEVGFGPASVLNSLDSYCLSWQFQLPVAQWALTQWKARLTTPSTVIEASIGYVFSCSYTSGEYKLYLFKGSQVSSVHSIVKFAPSPTPTVSPTPAQ